ncbi:DUF4290 domain-containing protein [Marinigracilibium pacificum]|uniref:DUF4290 domain-containing protein n=1 Tax=Marinigracilibium pacificum TaxID=2729599 RepID=A0A848J8N4_9BACT|nr:DUF4290 domain-containing protein [Marinigracilibium pacificum]NMM50739.1 DUF4290 domain-containing protein [Marinigracilibium pacificum]
MDYNTQRDHLILKEYGRNVQKLVDYITHQVDDRDQRTRYAKALIEMMKQIIPDLKDTKENLQKLWDDLYIISKFELDVDSPFPKPNAETLEKKPRKVAYNQHNYMRYRHYGINVELMISEAIAMEDQQQQTEAVIYIARLMKTFYMTWNKDNIEDNVLIEQIEKLANGKLKVDREAILGKNLIYPLYRDKENKPSGKGSKGGGRDSRDGRDKKKKRKH